MNTADSNTFKFKNNTGGKITITDEVRSNTGFTWATSHKNKELKDGESVEYVVTSVGNHNTFQYYGSMLKIHYKTEGNEASFHELGVIRLETCSVNMPTRIQVSFAFGKNGNPRMHTLSRQSGKYNGQPFYMDDKSKMKLYFEWEGNSTSPMSWRIDYHGYLIALHEGISKKTGITHEDLIWGFPLDCSYGGDISLAQGQYPDAKGIFFSGNYTESDSLPGNKTPTRGTISYNNQNMYKTWKPVDITSSFSSGESGWGADKLRYLHISYRDAVSFNTMSSSSFNTVKSSNSFQNIIHIPFGGIDTDTSPTKPSSSNHDEFHRPERTYELDTGAGSNTSPSNVLYEWEIVTARGEVGGESFQDSHESILGDVGHRFVTQYSKFTINLTDMGLSRWGHTSGFSQWTNSERVEVRFRVLGHLDENKSGDLRVSKSSEGKMGTWSEWKSIPRLAWIEGPKVFKYGANYWIDGELGSVDNHGNIYEKNSLTETDCGWDGRLVVRVATTDAKTSYWHPMVSVDEKIVLGTNKHKEAILVGGKYRITVHHHNGTDWKDDYPANGYASTPSNGQGILDLERWNLETKSHAPTWDPRERLRDESLYRGHADDGEWNYNGKGTYITGYECCEVDSTKTDLKASGFMFDIHTQNCSQFDWNRISLNLNGANKAGQSIIHWNRGEMGQSYGDGKNVADSELNGFRNSNVDFRMDAGPHQTRILNNMESVHGPANWSKGDPWPIFKHAGWQMVPNMEIIGLRNVRGIGGNYNHTGWHIGGNERGNYWVGGINGGGVVSGGTRAAHQGTHHGTYLEHNTYSPYASVSSNKYREEDSPHYGYDSALSFYSHYKLLPGMAGYGGYSRQWGIGGSFRNRAKTHVVSRLNAIKSLSSMPGGADSHDRSTIHFNNVHPTKTVKLKFGFIGSISTDDRIYYGLQCWDVTNNKWIHKLPTVPEYFASPGPAEPQATGPGNHWKMSKWSFPGSSEASIVQMRGQYNKMQWSGLRHDQAHSFNYVWSIPPKTHYKFGFFGVMGPGSSQIEYGGWRWWGCNVISGY